MAGVLHLVFRSLFLVRGDSMWPTLRDGDLIHARRGSTEDDGYARGAVVVAEIRAPYGEGASITSVKRVVGLPGELVRVDDDGAVRVEDGTLEEPYLTPEARAAPGPGLSWLCDDDEYFLMGDNRVDSADSRRYGPVPAADIVGRIRLRWPTHWLLGRKDRVLPGKLTDRP